MKNKKGFTLIELLAVIIILGILMIIAIPSVTKYISDSRKNSYVDTAKEIISGARNVVNEGKLGMYDTNTTYYIPSSYIKTENASKSPYGDFVQAYVVVTYDGTGYKYYWTSVDDAGQGVKGIISYDKLDTDNIESDLNQDMIDPTKTKVGIGNRTEIKVLDNNGNWIHEIHLDDTNNNVSEESGNSVVVYPNGKTKATVEVGDIVTIDTEGFYVVKRDGNDLVLLSQYNLKVGNIITSWRKTGEYTSSDPGYGRQSSDVIGFIQGESNFIGSVHFSDTNYWDGKVGTDYPGIYCSGSSDTNCAYVYDSHSNLYQYVNAYKKYLEGKGATIKSARLMSFEESIEFRQEHNDVMTQTSFWLGTARDSINLFCVRNGNDRYTFTIEDNPDYYSLGVRPVIVI